jgi:uncharacterized membrane protein
MTRVLVAPRKVLTVLIISTILVYRQIQFTKDRPNGYRKEHLLFVQTRLRVKLGGTVLARRRGGFFTTIYLITTQP